MKKFMTEDEVYKDVIANPQDYTATIAETSVSFYHKDNGPKLTVEDKNDFIVTLLHHLGITEVEYL